MSCETTVRKEEETHCQIVSQELHDQSAVFVRLLVQLVQLSDGIIKRLPRKGVNKDRGHHLTTKHRAPSANQTGKQEKERKVRVADVLGQIAGLLWRVEDLVEEDREVEGQAEADGVCGVHLLPADVKGVLVGLLRALYGFWKRERNGRSVQRGTYVLK